MSRRSRLRVFASWSLSRDENNGSFLETTPNKLNRKQGQPAMGGSSIKKIFAHKKKKSPLNKAWKKVRRALPIGKHNKRNVLSLGKLRRKKNSKKKQQQHRPALKRLSLGNKRKESTETASPGAKEDGGALGKLGEKIRRKLSRENTKGHMVKEEGVPAPGNTEEPQEQNEPDSPKNEEKAPRKTLKDVIRSIRPTGSKAAL